MRTGVSTALFHHLRSTRRGVLPRSTEEASAEWIAARDEAVLLLLYGSGLRVAEALGLTGAALPLGEALSVTGKRAKTRIVPLLAPVRAAIERYLALSPWSRSGGQGLNAR